VGTTDGAIYHFDGGTFEFRTVVGDAVVRILATETRVLAATTSSLFEKQIDGSWQESDVPIEVIRDLEVSPNGTLYLVGSRPTEVGSETGVLLMDDGAGWQDETDALLSESQARPHVINAVLIEGDDDIWVGGGRSDRLRKYAFLSRYDGIEWTTQHWGARNYITALARAGGELVVGSSDGLLRWTGSALEQTALPGEYVVELAALHDKHVFAVTASALFLFDGDDWTAVDSIDQGSTGIQLWVPEPWRAYYGSGTRLQRFDGIGVSELDHEVFLDRAANGAFASARTANGLYQLKDEQWTPICEGLDCPALINNSWPRGLDDVFVLHVQPQSPADPDYTILHTAGGASFTTVAGPFPLQHQSRGTITGAGDTLFVWVAGAFGSGVAVAVDGTVEIHDTLVNDVWAASEVEAFSVGQDGTIDHYLAGTWTTMDSPTTGELLAVTGSSPTDVWAVTRDELIHYDGSTWAIAEGAGARMTVFGGSNGIMSSWGTKSAYLDASGWQTISLPVPSVLDSTGIAGISKSHINVINKFEPTAIYHRYRPWDGCATIEEDCADRIDDDCDGYLDQHDSDCN
jgi:hypothetical protein